MRRFLIVATAILLLAVRVCGDDGLKPAPSVGPGEIKPSYVPGEIIFKLRAPVGITSISEAQVSALAGQVASRHNLTAAAPAIVGRANSSLRSIYRAYLAKGVSPVKASREISADLAVEWAEPNYLRYTTATPNDPSKGSQISMLNVLNAWDITTGSPNVIVAIVDTGVQCDHPDLAANIWTNPGEIAGDGIDNDGNGYIDDVHGWDFVSVSSSEVYPGEDPGPPDNDPSDVCGHGTHVAGIVGAVGNNRIGVVGMNWRVSLMPVRAGYKNTGGGGVLQIADIANALTYAANNGADVVNMSFGGLDASYTERAAIDYCVSAGVVLVAAAGNDGTDWPSYPAAFNNVISVASVDGMRARSSFSNCGLTVDVAAPGEYVYSTIPGGAYSSMSGTSMASPVIAGLAALIKSYHTDWTAEQIAMQIQSSATAPTSVCPYYNVSLGAGIPDAYQAVAQARPLVKLGVVSLSIDEESTTPDGILDPDETVRLLPSVRNFGTAQVAVSVSLTTTDPYVKVLGNDTWIGYLPAGRTATNRLDPFFVKIARNTPENHIAQLSLKTFVEGIGVVATDIIPLVLNPTFTKPLQIAPHVGSTSYSYSKLFGAPDNSLVVLYESRGNENFIYSRVMSPDGVWEPQQLVSAKNGITQAREIRGVMGKDGRLHACYGAHYWPSRTMWMCYISRDPKSGAWSTPVAISSKSAYDPSDDLRSYIALDQLGRPHVIWIDHRSGSPELYYSYFDGAKWSPEAPILKLVNSPVAYYLLFDSKGVGHLIWRSYYENTIYERLLSGGVWSESSPIASATQGGATYALMDSNDCIHLLYQKSNSSSVAYRKCEAGVWSAEAQVTGTSYISSYDVLINPDGKLRLTWQSPPNWSQDRNQQIWEFTYDGATTSPMSQLTFDCPKNRLGTPRTVVDSTGCRVLASDVLNPMGGGWNVMDEVALLTPKRYPDLIPTRPTVVDDGARTMNNKLLHATWSSSQSRGIANYWYAVGTAPGGTDVCKWTSAGSSTSVNANFTNKPLLEGQTYYFSVKAQGNAGYTSAVGVSDGITYQSVPTATTIQDLRTVATGMRVDLHGAIVSKSFGSFIYIETDRRECGIRVNLTGQTVSANQRVDVTGTAGMTADGEFCINGIATPSGYGNVKPIGLSVRSVTGQGLKSTGLLVSAWGKVKDVDTASPAGWFTMNDGSDTVKVIGPVGAVSASCRYVRVTGISSLEKVGSDVRRVIRVSSPMDIVTW